MYNRRHGISSTGYVAQETRFSSIGSIIVRQVGHSIIRDERHQESHLMTLPTIATKGLLTGRLYPELEGTCYICSSSGYLSTIEFEGKKGIGLGTKNHVTARITNIRDDSKVMFEISRQWSGQLKIKDCSTDQVVDEFKVDDVPLAKLEVNPIDKQSPWESRRAWDEVIGEIVQGNTHIEWPRVFFHKVEADQELELLA